MKDGLGRRESRKTVALQRCFRAAQETERVRCQIDMAIAAARHGQARLTGNILADITWSGIAPLLSNPDYAKDVKVAARSLKKDINAIHEMVSEKSGMLKTLDGQEKNVLRDKLSAAAVKANELRKRVQDGCGSVAPPQRFGVYKPARKPS